MIITKEDQNNLLAEFCKVERTTDEIIAFGDGLEATLGLIDKKMKDGKV